MLSCTLLFYTLQHFTFLLHGKHKRIVLKISSELNFLLHYIFITLNYLLI